MIGVTKMRKSYAVLERENAELRKRIEELEAQDAHAMRILESLTPQGSEFVADPVACGEYVRKRRNDQHESIKQQVKLRKRFEREVAEKDKRIEFLLKNISAKKRYIEELEKCLEFFGIEIEDGSYQFTPAKMDRLAKKQMESEK